MIVICPTGAATGWTCRRPRGNYHRPRPAIGRGSERAV